MGFRADIRDVQKAGSGSLIQSWGGLSLRALRSGWPVAPGAEVRLGPPMRLEGPGAGIALPVPEPLDHQAEATEELAWKGGIP